MAVSKLQDRLRSTRRTLIGHRIGIGACSIFALFAICLAASATADWVLELATLWRAAWMIGVATLSMVVVVIGWRRWIATYTLSDTAAVAERRLSQFGQRLRTTLDYEQRDPMPAFASPSLLNSLRDETHKLAGQLEWSEAVDSRPLFKTMLAASAVAVGWIAALSVVPEFRIAAARAMLLPLEYTTVTYSPQTATIRPGESVTVGATVAGRPIQSAQLRYRPTGSQADWSIVDLVAPDTEDKTENATLPVSLHGELSATLGDLTEDTEFEVIAGPRTLPSGFLRVLQPLMLERSEARIIPPSYTRHPDETVEGLDLKVLEGSDVELTLELNRPAAEAKLIRVESNSESTLYVEGAVSREIPLDLQGKVVRGKLADLRSGVSFTMSARAADGILIDPVRIHIRVQPDQMPHLKFIEPPEDLVVTPTTEVPLIVEAGDDIGLQMVGVMYQVGSGPMQTLLEQDAEDSPEPYRMSTILMLEEHRLTHQDAVTYYAFAEDNYFGQPRRTTTPLRFIDIRPFKLSFQVVDSKGCCKGSSITLEELITRQRQALSQAFQASHQSPNKATTSLLSQRQEELQDATIEFAAGLASRGMDLPALTEAANSMENAIEALDAIDLIKALLAEQQALAALIRARENVRQKLNQADSQCASACRKFDREQRQKLRLPEKKKSDQQQQLAKTRQKLDELAKREREWSQQAKQCCGSSGRSPSKSSALNTSTAQSSQPQSPQDSKQTPQDSNPLDSQQTGNEKHDALSPAEVAAVQEQLQSELAEIQKQLEKLDATGNAAHEQGEQAAESMRQGLADLQRQDGDAAAIEGERAAEQLEQLSSHLAAMNARDFGQRLDQALKLAQQLAGRQESLAEQLPFRSEKSGDENSAPAKTDRSIGELTRDQRGLAVQTGLLAELLERLKHDANSEVGAVKQMLEQADAKHPPREIAAGMRHTADDIQAERKAAAGRGAALARESLQGLSQSLGAARGEYAQPQLKELLSLEEQLAQLQQQMQRAHVKGEDPKVTAGEKWQQLESRLDQLATSDQQLADALQKLREGPQRKSPGARRAEGKSGQKNPASAKNDQSGATQGGKVPPKPGTQLKPVPVIDTNGQTPSEGFYSWLELGDFSGFREVSKALQTRIQEAILAGALIDADQPVPPAYKELVEKYYRALSDDLR